MLAHRRRSLVALLAAPWVLWAVARTFGLDHGHPLVSLMAFTPYVALTAIVPVTVALIAREWAVAALAAVALAALVVAVAPRALHGPQFAAAAPPPDRRLVVMTANLRFGEADARGIVALVRKYDVDVLSLLELSDAAVTRLDAAGAQELLPSRVLVTGFYERGIGLMARRPLAALAAPDLESDQLAVALTLSEGRQLRLVAVHPMPPTSRRSSATWRTTLRGLPGPAGGGVDNVLLGDFNGTLDNREVRRILDRGYVDAADATGAGLRPTFPAGRVIAPITIDHVLVPRTIAVHRLSVHDVRDSDHRAVIAELVLPPG